MRTFILAHRDTLRYDERGPHNRRYKGIMRARRYGSFIVAVAVSINMFATTAATSGDLPSYYSLLDYNLTSPTAWTTAAGGFANPAVYSMMPGGELEYYWTANKADALGDFNKWGLFTSAKAVGFGVVHQKIPVGSQLLRVSDYRLALSGGNRDHTTGIALSWSRGDTEALGRTTAMQVGTVNRIGRLVSVGLAGIFSTQKRDQAGLFDLAVRPLGDQRLTIFSDLEWPKGVSFTDGPWSAGAMVEIPAGVRFIGRFHDDDSFSFALAYTFGGGMNAGHARGSVQPVYNSSQKYAATNWGVRLGFKERNGVFDSMTKDQYYVGMRLKGPVVHTRFRYFDRGMTLSAILDAIENARIDQRVAGVALNLSGLRVSRGSAWEIREKLMQLRNDGKSVVVYIDYVGISAYHIASAADRIVMDPEGLLVLPGYAMGRTYLATLAERFGVGIEEWRFSTYKSAMEAFTRHDMSDADREQRQAIVDGYYDTMRRDVAAGRKVDAATVDGWIDDITAFTPELAREEGVVDVVGRWDDMKKVVADLEGSRKTFTTAGSIGRKAYPSQRWGEPEKIAVVYAEGACAMDTGINARRLERTFKELRNDGEIKAVVLRVNSPGGSPLASDVVAAAMKKCAARKPLIVSQGDVAASGGYWISMVGDEIVTQPTSVTGSIGYIGAWVWDKGISEKIGVEGDFVKAGEHADLFFNLKLPYLPIGIAHRGLDDEERERVLDRMGVMYDGFVGKVAENRELDKNRVAELAQGRVWTGAQAVDNGLADRIGGLDVAINLAIEKAGLVAEDVEVIHRHDRGLFDFGSLNPVPWASTLAFWRDAKTGDSNRDVSEAAPATWLFGNYELLYLQELAKNNGKPMCMIPPDFLPRDNEQP